MRALVSHRPSAVSELDDKFDASWIRQQAEAGALSLQEVHALVRYVGATIAEWQARVSSSHPCPPYALRLGIPFRITTAPHPPSQAPVDDAETREWVASVEATLHATAAMELLEFIGVHMVTIVRGAFEKVGQVCARALRGWSDRGFLSAWWLTSRSPRLPGVEAAAGDRGRARRGGRGRRGEGGRRRARGRALPAGLSEVAEVWRGVVLFLLFLSRVSCPTPERGRAVHFLDGPGPDLHI